MKKAIKPIIFILFLCMLYTVPVFAANKKVTAKYINQTITIKANKKGTQYQWQIKKRNKKEWKKIKGKKKTLKIKATWDKNNAQYRCEVTKKGKKVYTKPVTLIIEKNPIIIAQPTTQYTRKGGFVDFETEAYGGNELIYTWQTSTDNTNWKEAGLGKRVRYVAKQEDLYVRCQIKNKITNGITYTQVVRLYVTDNTAKYYGKDLPDDAGRGIFKPKALDKHIYLYSYNSKFKTQIKKACANINQNIGKNTFIYTDAPYVADIIIMDFDRVENELEENIFTKNGTQDYLMQHIEETESWGGLTFSDTIYGEHFLIELNRELLLKCKTEKVTAVIMHEIGHCIGINHVKDTTSLMNAALKTNKMSESDIKLFLEHVGIIENLENKYFK